MRELVKEKKRMERYAIIIRPNEEMALPHCYPGDSLDLKTLQEIVEGHIETVPTALAAATNRPASTPPSGWRSCWRANGAMSRGWG